MIIIAITIITVFNLMTNVVDILIGGKNVAHFTKPIEIPDYCDNIYYYRSNHNTWICKKDKSVHMIILMYANMYDYNMTKYTTMRLYGYNNNDIEKEYWDTNNEHIFLSHCTNFNNEIINLKSQKSYIHFSSHIKKYINILN